MPLHGKTVPSTRIANTIDLFAVTYDTYSALSCNAIFDGISK